LVPKVKIQINGETREFSEGLTMDSLISILSLEPTRVAVELNRNVVRRSDWPTTLLHDDDRVEIVHFVGGGASVSSKPVSSEQSLRFSIAPV
jgi:thiamine biosynthesis protein ThiS